MTIPEIIRELEAAAQQEAAGIHALETTHFEPELARIAPSCIAAARRRAEALVTAAQWLKAAHTLSEVRAMTLGQLEAAS